MTKSLFLTAVPFLLISGVATAQTPAAPMPWAQVARAFDEGKFAAVLRNVDRFVEQGDAPSEVLPRYYRGAARVEALWHARTGVPLGSAQPIEARRDSFEIVFPATFVSQHEAAQADLAAAFFTLSVAQAQEEFDADKAIEARIKLYRAVSAFELATHSSQTTGAFSAALSAVSALDATRLSGPLAQWARTAELRARVATGDFAGAMASATRWSPVGAGEASLGQALPALVGACDLTGNFARGRGFLLGSAYVALKADPEAAQSGKLDPARRALRAHLQNLGLAADQKREAIAKPLQLARHAAAYFLHDRPAPADKQFIIEAARRLREEFKEPVPLDLELFAILTAVRSGTEAEAKAARERLGALLARDPDNAGLRAARGIDAALRGDFKPAETELTAATTRDAFWVLSLGAFEALADVYENTGRPELARKTVEDASGLRQLLSALAR